MDMRPCSYRAVAATIERPDRDADAASNVAVKRNGIVARRGGRVPRVTRMRPTFELALPLSPDDAIGRVRRGLEAGQGSERCMSRGRCAELFVPERERRLWSPYLSVQAERAEDGSVLHGRFSPTPEVWTFVLFAYGVACFAVLFGGVLGYVQWASGEPAWGLWGVGLGVPVIALLHAASAVGQRLGDAQMADLQARLERLLEWQVTPKVGREVSPEA
jgi:hypothetical protein